MPSLLFLNGPSAIVKLYGELQHAEPKAKLYVGKENLRRRVARL